MTEDKFRDKLLRKLDEYNESLLDDYLTVRKAKNAKNTDTEIFSKCTESPHKRNNRRKKKNERKKRSKRQKIIENINCEKSKQNCDKLNNTLTGQKRTLHDLKNELGLVELERKQKYISKEQEENCRVSDKKGPEVVVFQNPSKRKRKQEDRLTETSRKKTSDQGEQFDMKRARHEVRKFGIRGFEGDKKEEAMVALLVQLGAKPPKNKHHNYKQFIEMKKEEKIQKMKQREIDRSLGFKVPKNKGPKRTKDRNDVGGCIDGQVGKYKSGVQFVQKADLKGIRFKQKK